MKIRTGLLCLLMSACDCGEGDVGEDTGADASGTDVETPDTVASDTPDTDAGGEVSFCDGSGPLIVPGVRGTDRCADRLAGDVFRFALCSCADLTLTSGIRTDSFDSLTGTTRMDGGGSVGVNGSMGTTEGSEIGGVLWVSNDFRSTSTTTVHTDMHVGGGVLGNAEVSGRAFVGESIMGREFTVAGELTMPDGADEGRATYATLRRAPVTVDDQCRCNEADIPDIAGLVAAFQTDNDNADIGLSPDALRRNETALTLPCGRYYLSGIENVSEITLQIEGRVALFVAGDILLNEGLDVQFTGEGEVDLFVVGNVSSTGGIRLGDEARPSRSRLYVGGTSVAFTAESTIVGNIYAPRADVSTTGGIELFGSVVAGSFSSTGASQIHYDQDILRIGERCMPPENCSMCGDCDTRDACIDGECGECTVDADCCPPLVCSAGACLPLIL